MKELTDNQLYNVEGGALIGGIVGAIFGGAAGLVVACGAIASTGNASLNTVWKCYVTGALAGAAIGAVTPI